MKTRKILLIVEGEDTEVNLFNKIGELFLSKETKLEFYPYQTNLYALYHQLKKKDFCFTILEKVLKELAPKSKDTSILDDEYSEKYLIFDAEFQDKNYSDRKLTEMIEFFNDELEQGKLYVNYPMIESYRHHGNYNIAKYIDTSIALKGLNSDSYKNLVNENGNRKKLEAYTQKTIFMVTKLNLIKSNAIINSKPRLPNLNEYKNELTQSNILNKQIEFKNSTKYINVLNTCLFFIVDYFGEKIYTKIKNTKLQ